VIHVGRRRIAGLGELTSAIAIIAVSAVAASVLIYAYTEQEQDRAGAIRDIVERDVERAGESLSVSSVSCVSAGHAVHMIISNYGEAPAASDVMTANITAYLSVGESLVNIDGANSGYANLDGSPASRIVPGGSVTASYGTGVLGVCGSGSQLVLVTPAGNIMRVSVP